MISLDTLPPGEAAALLARLAARPGLRAGDAAVGEITGLCGYLPLAIGMLARQLRHHPAWTAGELAADLAVARDRLALMHAENLSVAAAFGLSYADLTPGQQRLFRRLGLHPGPDIDAYAAAALDGTTPGRRPPRPGGLYDQHLLTEPAPGRYQLHDLLREHARALAAARRPRRIRRRGRPAAGLLPAHRPGRRPALRHLVPAARRPPPGRPPAQAPGVSAPGQAAAWLEAERANLHAAADYAAARGRSLHAVAIPAAMSGFLAARGYWDQSAALHQGALAAARQAGDRLGEADTLAELGVLQGETGDYPAAAASLARALALYGEAGDLPGQAHTLNQLAYLRILTGDYPAAAASCQQALALARSASDRPVEAGALIDLGLVQQLTGDYPAAAASHQQALALSRDLGDLDGQAEPSAAWPSCSKRPGTTRPPPPASSRPWRCSATWQPSRPGLGPQRPRRRAARDRGLPGRRRQPPAGPGAVPRPRQPARPGRGAQPPRRTRDPRPRTPRRPASITPRRWPSPATSARPWRKHAPWKDSAKATCKTPAPAKPPRTCGRHWRSTSASAPQLRGESRRYSKARGSPPPHPERQPAAPQAAKATTHLCPLRPHEAANSPGIPCGDAALA